ncbi:hypothetical protein M413DRAFT_252360 [Hebeloma cylindrosporum]|uniref:Uncharacterized protein n=1 Tax=Hebeloma cylindrosporum TaxID=76867 RepID=A0A0C3C0T9_HEBCY|nr:hypothetical protein M413DRAFT_252360 [Hebeloma cylindrosporum h7]
MTCLIFRILRGRSSTKKRAEFKGPQIRYTYHSQTSGYDTSIILTVRPEFSCARYGAKGRESTSSCINGTTEEITLKCHSKFMPWG